MAKAAKKKYKDDGRPAGSANKKSGFVRSERFQARITVGAAKTVQALIDEAGYKTPSDVFHDALQQLAYKKLEDKTHIYWAKQIQ